eukprot:scaffold110350_cov45-Attheya_sp.AAC.1
MKTIFAKIGAMPSLLFLLRHVDALPISSAAYASREAKSHDQFAPALLDDSSCHLQSQGWDILKLDNATITFDEASKTEEIKMFFNISDRTTQITVFQSDCKTAVLDSVVAASETFETQSVTHLDLTVILDIKEETIQSSPIWDFDTETNMANIDICVRVGLMVVKTDGTTIGVNFLHSELSIAIDMSVGFESASFETEEYSPGVFDREAALDFFIESCQECDNGWECIVAPIIQSEFVNICLTTNSSGTRFESLDTFQLSQSFGEGSFMDSKVQSGLPMSELTSVEINGNKLKVTTQPANYFFLNEDEPVIANGIAMIEFGANPTARRLLRASIVPNHHRALETRLEVLQPVASAAPSMHLISGQKIPTVPPAPAIATVRAPPTVATESDDQNTNTIVEETQRLDEQSNSGDTIVEETQRLDEQSNSGDTIVEGTQRLDEQSNSGDTIVEDTQHLNNNNNNTSMRTLRSSRRSAPFQSTTTATTVNEYYASSSSDSSDDSSSKSEYANDSSDLNDDASSIGEYANDSSNLNDDSSNISVLRDEAVGDSPRNSNNTIQHDASASSSPQVPNGGALSAVSPVGKAFKVRIKLSSDASDSHDESTSSNVWKTSGFDNNNGDWRSNYGEGAKDFDIYAEIKPGRKKIPKSNKPVGNMHDGRDEWHIIANEVGTRMCVTLENPHFSELLKDFQVENDSIPIGSLTKQRFSHNLLRFLHDVIGVAFVREDFLTNDLFEIGDDEALTNLKRVYTKRYNRETKEEKL